MLLEELRQQKKNERQAYSQALEVQNNPDISAQAPKETAKLPELIQASDECSKTTPSAAPESPSPSRDLIATSPHVMSDDGCDSSAQAICTTDKHPTTDPPAQRNLSNDFVAAVDGVSSDEESSTSRNDAAEENAEAASCSPQAEEETRESEASTVCPASDVFDEDPNIGGPSDTNDYVTLDSDGECEGDSVYDDDDDNLDWVEPDPGSDDEAASASDLLFDPALPDAVGGVDAVSRGVVRASVLGDMHENGWTVHNLQTPSPTWTSRMKCGLMVGCTKIIQASLMVSTGLPREL
ncbi:hypothetical protein PR002_g2906 [Phytophthora rubi]|uniref:PiggyBac transposable element-derived protein domain-containing protein n=1 Tax=Phytophthora rubi TaxID=129364 RepID=A0A6A3NRV0_9STRA|nr:hypothetical protein PR002_g2906 [Phytophthora rubi]